MENQEAEIIHQETTHIIRRSKLPKCNLKSEELKALKSLRNNKNIIILPADKGNSTVIMNREDYKQKINELLRNPIYKKTNTDPTTYLEKITKEKIKSSSINKQDQQRLIPREKSSKCPKLYGLPKVHKQGVPLRPIVSSIG